MIRLVTIVLISVTSLSWAEPGRDYFSPEYTARRATQAVWNNLQRCGLSRMNAWDPQLPRPLIPADFAIVNRHWQVLAYYREAWFSGGVALEFKNPNGGYNHNISFNNYRLQAITPYAGTVALANQVSTVGGSYFNLSCRNYPIYNVYDFERCLAGNYVNVISDQLCRFGALQ